MRNNRQLQKQVVLGEECPSDDAEVHPDTKELTEAANLSQSGSDLLPQLALNFFGRHVEFIVGCENSSTLGMWLLSHHHGGRLFDCQV